MKLQTSPNRGNINRNRNLGTHDITHSDVGKFHITTFSPKKRTSTPERSILKTNARRELSYDEVSHKPQVVPQQSTGSLFGKVQTSPEPQVVPQQSKGSLFGKVQVSPSKNDDAIIIHTIENIINENKGNPSEALKMIKFLLN
jgi:hypothetical protein